MEIQQVIEQHLDTLLMQKSQQGALSLDTIIEIGAYVGAGVLRGRYSAVKEVSQEEINGVFGVIGNFYKRHFEEAFTENEFILLKNKALELVQNTSFDADLEAFMK